MECNFGVLKDSAFLSTKILNVIEINNFFSKKINNLVKFHSQQVFRYKTYATHRKQGGLKP